MKSLVLKKPRAVIFDWDNTLVDTWPVILAATNAALKAVGYPVWTLAEVKMRVRRSMRDAFPEMFGDRWQEASAAFFNTFQRIHLKKLLQRPGAENMLTELSQEGFYLGVVSNKHGSYLRKEAKYLNWDHFFGRLVGAADAKRDKPAREPVDLVLEGSGILASGDVWFVGDTDVDLECAKQAGCVPILLCTEVLQEAFIHSPPYFHFSNCENLCKYLKNL